MRRAARSGNGYEELGPGRHRHVDRHLEHDGPHAQRRKPGLPVRRRKTYVIDTSVLLSDPGR